MTTEMKFRNETFFTDAVVDLAKMYGWLVYHNRGDMKRHVQGHPGFPDLVLVKRGMVIFRELKMTPKSPYQPGQTVWLAGLDDIAKVWYPTDWDEIVATLSSIL